MTANVQIVQLPHAQGLPLPFTATEGAAGYDLPAAISETDPITLNPGDRKLVATGLKIALPIGFEAQVRPRSGLALRHGVTVLNAPGTIDSDYRGELSVLLINHGQEPFVIERGERIAQLVIAEVSQITWEEKATLSDSARGDGGYGSTGRR